MKKPVITISLIIITIGSGILAGFFELSPHKADYSIMSEFDYDMPAVAMDIDSKDNIVTAGYQEDSNNCLYKYDSAGNLLWNASFGFGGGYKDQSLITCDNADNIIVFSYRRWYEDIWNEDNTTFTKSLKFLHTIFIKFNPNGQLLWEKTMNLTHLSGIYDIDVDSANNILITGSKNDTAGIYNIYVAKYSGEGILIWDGIWGTDRQEYGRGVAIDSQDNIYLSGIRSGFDNSESASIIVKFDKGGQLQWNKSLAGNGSIEKNLIVCDNNGKIYVIGADINRSTPYWNYTVFLEKYDSTGFLLWTKNWEDIEFYASGFTIDSHNNLYALSSHYRYFILKFSSNGNLRYIFNLPSRAGSSIMSGIRCNSKDKIFVVGTANHYTDDEGWGDYSYINPVFTRIDSNYFPYNKKWHIIPLIFAGLAWIVFMFATVDTKSLILAKHRNQREIPQEHSGDTEKNFVDSNRDIQKSHRTLKTLAAESLEKKWIPDQEKNQHLLGGWCPFCEDVEGYCPQCICPPEICGDQATEGWIGQLKDKYGDETKLSKVDPDVYQKIVKKFQGLADSSE